MTESTPTPAEHPRHCEGCQILGLMHERDVVTAERDALAAVIEQARYAIQRDANIYEVVGDTAEVLSTAPATVLAQRDARVLGETADKLRDAGLIDAIAYGHFHAEADRIEREAQS